MWVEAIGSMICRFCVSPVSWKLSHSHAGVEMSEFQRHSLLLEQSVSTVMALQSV